MRTTLMAAVFTGLLVTAGTAAGTGTAAAAPSGNGAYIVVLRDAANSRPSPRSTRVPTAPPSGTSTSTPCAATPRT
jgi:hypothetical protein